MFHLAHHHHTHHHLHHHTTHTITSPIIIIHHLIHHFIQHHHSTHKKSFKKTPLSHTLSPLKISSTFTPNSKHFSSKSIIPSPMFHYHNLQIINSLYYHQPSKI